MGKAADNRRGISSTIGCFLLWVFIFIGPHVLMWESKFDHVVSWNLHILQSQLCAEVWAVSRQYYGDDIAECMMDQAVNVINRADDRRDLIDAAAALVNSGRPSALNLQRLSRIWEETKQSCHGLRN